MIRFLQMNKLRGGKNQMETEDCLLKKKFLYNKMQQQIVQTGRKDQFTIFQPVYRKIQFALRQEDKKPITREFLLSLVHDYFMKAIRQFLVQPLSQLKTSKNDDYTGFYIQKHFQKKHIEKFFQLLSTIPNEKDKEYVFRELLYQIDAARKTHPSQMNYIIKEYFPTAMKNLLLRKSSWKDFWASVRAKHSSLSRSSSSAILHPLQFQTKTIHF